MLSSHIEKSSKQPGTNTKRKETQNYAGYMKTFLNVQNLLITKLHVINSWEFVRVISVFWKPIWQGFVEKIPVQLMSFVISPKTYTTC